MDCSILCDLVRGKTVGLSKPLEDGMEEKEADIKFKMNKQIQSFPQFLLG